MTNIQSIHLPTRRIDPALAALIRSLQVGQRIEITQKIRVGKRSWEAQIQGIFRSVNYLATGVTTERVPEDDVVVPILHFTKDNGEYSSVAIDENSSVKIIA